MKPEFAKQHGDRLAKHGDEIQNLAEAAIRLEDENVGLTKRLERAIVVPGEKPTPEEIKDFKAKMGLPDNAEGYQFDPGDAKELPGLEEITKNVRQAAFEAGMTKTQAQQIYTFIVGGIKAGQDSRATSAKEAADKFMERLTALYEGDPKKAEAAKNLYQSALVRMSGRDKDLAKKLLDAGLFYEPSLIAGIAEAEQHVGDHEFIDGGAGPSPRDKPKQGRFGSNYSPEFQRTYGKGGQA
jgi:hypothetical protein